MSLEHLALAETDNFPIRHQGKIHNGKVRSVYWLTSEDSKRISREYDYTRFQENPELGVMIISDRISAFDCNWQGEDNLGGVPGKGAALNAISEYWFNQFASKGLANSHLVALPHPLVWIVKRAQPVMIEAIARQYITGSMWRAYSKGEREFCGIHLPEGLKENQKLDRLLVTPTTKGTLHISGIPAEEDVNLTPQNISDNYRAFGFQGQWDIVYYEKLLAEGFQIMSEQLSHKGQICVDTKFEFGYTFDDDKEPTMILIDEIGTLDSSRMWDAKKYAEGVVVENSKEQFRKYLMGNLGRDILTNSKRMAERKELARTTRIPAEEMMKISDIYRTMTSLIIDSEMETQENPREEILEALNAYGIVE